MASLLVTALLSAGIPAAAEPPQARGIERVCPAPSTTDDDDGGEASFPDQGTTHGEAITCAAEYGLVTGFEDGTFRPDQPVTRGQMASMVAASVQTATGLALAQPDEVPFTDIDGNVHAESIAALAAAGIVSGRADDTFGPEETLTRGQFTRAVANAISYADVFTIDGPLPPADDDVDFTDVLGTTFESSILSLAGVGIALGTADGSFQPQAPVTRGQLATFMMRAADYLDHHQRWRPTARSGEVLVAELEAVLDTPETEPEAPDDEETGEDAPDDGEPEADGTPPRASVTLSINAFNGTLGYIIDLSDAPGPYADEGATVHLGDPAVGGPVVLTLADGETLGDASDRVATGVVHEADSTLRFADLVRAPEDAYVQIATVDAPDGAVRGGLRSPTD